jgi:hypothetical protein
MYQLMESSRIAMLLIVLATLLLIGSQVGNITEALSSRLNAAVSAR